MKKYTVHQMQESRLKTLLVEFEEAAREHELELEQGWCRKARVDALQRCSDAENKLLEYLYSKGLK